MNTYPAGAELEFLLREHASVDESAFELPHLGAGNILILEGDLHKVQTNSFLVGIRSH